MKITVMGLGLAAALLAVPGRGSAQVIVGIDIRFPEPPPLVVVTPGIRIVPEYDQEVYFVNNYYWVRRDEVWYRTPRYDGGWRPVKVVYVPAALVRIPPGRYRHYYRDDDGYWRPHEAAAYHDWRDRHPWDERRAWWHEHRHDQIMRAEQERSWREHRRQDREMQLVEMRRQQEERDRRRADMRREHDERERMHREHERDDRGHGQGAGHHDDRGPHDGGGGPPGHDRDHGHL